MKKINGQPVSGIETYIDTTGGEVLKWNASTGKMVWELEGGKNYTIRWYGERGVFAQTAASTPNRIQYITIASTGNSIDFGDIIIAGGQSEGQGGQGCSNGSRGILFGGGYPSHDIIQYVTISTPGNATDFGDMIQNNYNGGALSNGPRGVHGGGAGIDSTVDIIEYITIATTGNSTDFGDMLNATGGGLAGFCDGSRGCFAGQLDPGGSGAYGIQYITVATTGNATDFGDLTVYRYSVAAVENGTRGVIGAGRSGGYVNTMDYVTIASTGNATDFGDSTTAAKGKAGASNGTRGVFAGGLDGSNYNVIDYITIANTGNATDFGDLLEVASNIAGMSGD